MTPDAFMAKLEHPLKPQIEAARTIIRDASPEIIEEVKWNAPSYRTATADFFATFHLRSQDKIQLVFHRGAKAKASKGQFTIEATQAEVKWLAPDRCLITVRDLSAITAIVQQWLRQL